MDAASNAAVSRFGGYAALGASACALAGAALWGASGADLDMAVATGDIEGYLVAAGQARGLLVGNLLAWMVMVVLWSMAGTVMASVCASRPTLARVATYFYWLGAPLVLAAYLAWLGIVLQVAPDTSPAAVQMTKLVGWFSSRADWVATIFMVGIGPTLISAAGRRDWVPSWLARWGILTSVAAVLTAVAMLTGGSGLSTYGFIIIPVGVGWTIAAGIVLLRRARTL